MNSPFYLKEVRSWLNNPVYIAEAGMRLAIKHLFARLLSLPAARWVDIGCGTGPYQALLPDGHWIGVDVPTSGRPLTMKTPDVFYDGTRLPLSDCSVGGVLCTQVMEHTRHLQPLVTDIERILQPGGWCVVSVPMAWEEHEIPFDFRRFTVFGLKDLLESAGLELIELMKVGGSYETMAQVVAVTLYTNFTSRMRHGGRLVAWGICAPLQLLGLVCQRLLPDAGTFYLNVAVLARKPVVAGQAAALPA